MKVIVGLLRNAFHLSHRYAIQGGIKIILFHNSTDRLLKKKKKRIPN